jgi:hypothetical protein
MAVETLTAVRKGDLVADDRYWPPAVRRVLAACVEAGTGQLRASDARRLLYPVLLVLEEQGRIDEFEPEWRALSHRQDLWKSTILERIRDRVPSSEMDTTGRQSGPELEQPEQDGPRDSAADSDSSPDAIGLAERLPANPPALADAFYFKNVLAATAAVWVGRRDSLLLDERASGDAWLMRAMTICGLTYPTLFAEALWNDEEVWGTRALGEYAEGLPCPLLDQEAGLAASALLNSRIRGIRPRLFLRFPETLVLEPIGQRSDISRLEREVVDWVAEPLLRTAERIDEEISRPKDRRPRKGAFQDIRDQLGQVLGTLGYRLVGSGGSKVNFDPAMHVSFVSVEAGEPVTIIRPGLQSISDGIISVKAQVNPSPTDGGAIQ